MKGKRKTIKANKEGEEEEEDAKEVCLVFFSGEENKEVRRRVGVARRASEFYIKAVLDAARVTEEGAGMV